jgi:hypothetical protein
MKIHSKSSFRGEVKPEAPCHKILKHVKKSAARTKILCKVKFITPFAPSSCLLQDDSAGKIARELQWANQEFFSVDIIPSWFSKLIYHLGDEQ